MHHWWFLLLSSNPFILLISWLPLIQMEAKLFRMTSKLWIIKWPLTIFPLLDPTVYRVDSMTSSSSGMGSQSPRGVSPCPWPSRLNARILFLPWHLGSPPELLQPTCAPPLVYKPLVLHVSVTSMWLLQSTSGLQAWVLLTSNFLGRWRPFFFTLHHTQDQMLLGWSINWLDSNFYSEWHQ